MEVRPRINITDLQEKITKNFENKMKIFEGNQTYDISSPPIDETPIKKNHDELIKMLETIQKENIEEARILYNYFFDKRDIASIPREEFQSEIASRSLFVNEVNDTSIRKINFEIKRLFNLLKSNGIVLNDTDLYFFLKSLYLYEFKKYLDKCFHVDSSSSQLIDEAYGRLNISSVNCFNCILDYKTTSSSLNTVNLFVKVVDYKDYENDLVIFDIINGAFFNMLVENKIRTFKDFTSVYRYSFLSYYYKYSESNFLWTYNKLLYISNEDYQTTETDDIYSPYNPNKNNQYFYNWLNHG